MRSCTALNAHGTICIVTKANRGPGLRKTRGEPLGAVRSVALVRSSDVAWRELLEGADIVSEGSLSGGASENAAWFGSTSIVVSLPHASDVERARLVELARIDPHLRLRLLRIAHREAAVRAPARLGRASCELRAAVHPRGLRIDVDVQAPLIGMRLSGRDPGT